MPHLLLSKVLDGANIKRDGAAYLLAEELEVTAYISLGHEVLQVARLARIEVAADLVTLQTHKSERFFFPPEQVVGLRIGGESKANRTAAGFR